jgi:hypothetical protein
MEDVGTRAAEVAVEAHNLVPIFQQALAKVGTQKPGAAGN